MTHEARVSVNEAELLGVARALVSPEAYNGIEGTLVASRVITKIGPTAMRRLESTLARGVVKMLARLGGADLRIRADRGDRKPARVFDVRPTPTLAFSAYSFELVRWLASAPLSSHANCPRFEGTVHTLGDEVCAYLALRLVAGERVEPVVASSPGLHTPLVWLGFARAIGGVGDGLVAPSYDALLATEDGRTIVESLRGDLTRRWLASIAWRDDELLDAEHALRMVTLEAAVLNRFVDAASRADRLDLATFLVEAGARALPPGVSPRDVAGRAAPRVRPQGTLRARSESRRHAGALFAVLGRLSKKRDELALVGFIDEGYEVAQATLSSWEILPREAFARAEAVVAALGSLDPLAQPSP